MNKFERTKPKVSIIMPNWFEEGQDGKYGKNETFILASKCLKRLIDITPRDAYELILIDNGSTLSDADGVNEMPYRIWSPSGYFRQADILIRNKFNKGFAPACNQGFALARGEYVVCINNDIFLFNENWLDLLIQPFEKPLYHDPLWSPRGYFKQVGFSTALDALNHFPGLVMPNIIKKDYQKNCLNEHGRLDMEKVFALKKEDIELPHQDELEPHAQFGSLWCAKRETLEELRKEDGFVFDEQFLVGFQEDRDLYQRIYQMGLETYRTNQFRVAHIGNLTMSKIKNRKIYTEANREKFKKKWNL